MSAPDIEIIEDSNDATESLFSLLNNGHEILYMKETESLTPTNSNVDGYWDQSVLAKLLHNIKKEEPNEAHVVKIVSELNVNELRSIYYEIFKKDISNLSKTVTSIVFVCIKTILFRWKGYIANYDQSVLYRTLVVHLKDNLSYILKIADEYIKRCNKNHRKNYKDSAELSCTYKKLKTLIFYDVHPKYNTIVNWNCLWDNKVLKSMDDVLVRQVANSRFIEVKVKFPFFEMTRLNIHKSEYKVIKLFNNDKFKGKLQNVKLRFKVLPGERDSFPPAFIREYLRQIKHMVKMHTAFPINKKLDVVGIIEEFEKDFELCVHEIETNIEYYCPLNRFPYTRYLGQSIHDKMNTLKLDYKSQITTHCDSKNFRLQEIIYPIVMFTLNRFNVFYQLDEDGKYKFELGNDFIPLLINKNIIFKCTLCDYEKYGFLAKFEMGQHILEEHGDEPNWLCLQCNKEVTARALHGDRWQHNCGKK